MEKKDNNLITIENFDPSGTGSNGDKATINSPRSVEAMRRQGIKQGELVKLTKNQIREKNKNKQFATEELFNEFCKHLEERRLQKIDLIKKERQIIIDEENNFASKTSGSKMYQSSSSNIYSRSTDGLNAIEKEKLMFEKIEKRQNKEIQMKLEFEMKMDEMRTQNQARIEKLMEKQMKHEIEINEKKKYAEDKRKQQELEKQKRLQLEEENKKKQFIQAELEEKERIKREKAKQEERLKQAKIKELEKQKKQEQISHHTKEILKKQEEELLEKQRLLREKEEQRKAKMDEENEMRKKLSREQRELLEKKLKSAKEKNDLYLKKQKEEYDKRQIMIESKRKQFEAEQLKRLNQLRDESIRRSEEIRKVLSNNMYMEEKKRNDYLKKLSEHEKRRQEIERQIQAEEKMRLKLEQEREEKRRVIVLENNEKQMKDKTQNILDKLNLTEYKVMKAKEKLKNDLMSKQNLMFLKRLDREENVQRIQKVDLYKREKIFERIQGDAQRTMQKKRELENLIKYRMKLRAQLEFKKEKLVNDLNDKRKRKIMMSTRYSSPDLFRDFKKTNPNNLSQNDSMKGNESFESLTDIKESIKNKMKPVTADNTNKVDENEKPNNKEILKTESPKHHANDDHHGNILTKEEEHQEEQKEDAAEPVQNAD